MDVRRLRTFVAVAEHGSVSKAANLLRATQPALSRQIRTLEEEFGFPLFERAGRRLALTPRGQHLLGDCRSLVRSVATLAETAQELRRGEIRLLKVAASALTIEAIFPRFLHRYAAAFPDTQLSLIEADAAEHLNLLARGDAHLAINVINAIQVDDHRFGSRTLSPFHIVAAYAPSLEIGVGTTADIAKILDYPLLLLNPSFATRNVFDAACRVAGIRPNIFFESGAVHSLLALAEAGHGIAILPSIVPIEGEQIRTARVTHRNEWLHLSLAVLWDKGRTLPRYAEGFAALLSAHVKETFSPGQP
jgi:DNA-binding transcriptional LysR family regulator